MGCCDGGGERIRDRNNRPGPPALNYTNVGINMIGFSLLLLVTDCSLVIRRDTRLWNNSPVPATEAIYYIIYDTYTACVCLLYAYTYIVICICRLYYVRRQHIFTIRAFCTVLIMHLRPQKMLYFWPNNDDDDACRCYKEYYYMLL